MRCSLSYFKPWIYRSTRPLFIDSDRKFFLGAPPGSVRDVIAQIFIQCRTSKFIRNGKLATLLVELMKMKEAEAKHSPAETLCLTIEHCTLLH